MQQRHCLAVECPVELDAEVGRQIKAGRGLAQAFGQRQRPDRQVLRFERTRAGEHGEAPAEHEQRLAMADFGLAGDFLQREGLLELCLVDQAHAAGGDRGARPLRPAVLVGQSRQTRFEGDQEARGDVGPAAPELAQRLEAALLRVIAACLLGEAEQLLVELVECVDQPLLEDRARLAEHGFENGPRSRRQPGLPQAARLGCGGRRVAGTSRFAAHGRAWIEVFADSSRNRETASGAAGLHAMHLATAKFGPDEVDARTPVSRAWRPGAGQPQVLAPAGPPA